MHSRSSTLLGLVGGHHHPCAQKDVCFNLKEALKSIRSIAFANVELPGMYFKCSF